MSHQPRARNGLGRVGTACSEAQRHGAAASFSTGSAHVSRNRDIAEPEPERETRVES